MHIFVKKTNTLHMFKIRVSLLKFNKFFGRRVIKTGIAVFITASICIKLDLPVVFAVITAIVTTEPTALDSFKKGILRLPAAAIGAGFALFFDQFFGHSAMTFALVAVLTILVCHHMKLDNGTLVATLTAVAMIPGTNDSLISEFIFRLSGTSIGIIISTLVNFSILPPKFGPLLVEKINKIYYDVGVFLKEAIELDDQDQKNYSKRLRNLNQELEKAYQLSEYQQAEWNYRKTCEFEQRSFCYVQNKLTYLDKIISHVANITHINMNNIEFSPEEKKIVLCASKKINELSKNFLSEKSIEGESEIFKQQLFQIFRKEVVENTNYNLKKSFYYELLEIFNSLLYLQQATKEEQQFSAENEKYPSYIFQKVQYE